MQIAVSASGVSWRRAYRNVFARQTARRPPPPTSRIARWAAPRKSPSFRCPKRETWDEIRSACHRQRCKTMSRCSSWPISIDFRPEKTRMPMARRAPKKLWLTRLWCMQISIIRFRPFSRPTRPETARMTTLKRSRWKCEADSSTITRWSLHRTSTDIMEIWWVDKLMAIIKCKEWLSWVISQQWDQS